MPIFNLYIPRQIFDSEMEENNDSYHEQNKEPNDADSENQDSYHQSNTEDESNDEK